MTARGGAEVSVVVLVCGNVFDDISDTLPGPAEILVEGNLIGRIERSVGPVLAAVRGRLHTALRGRM